MTTQSELRRDPILRRWVIIAPERRGDVVRRRVPPPPVAEEGPCPFCPGNESMNPNEIYVIRRPNSPNDTPTWRVRITPDKKPLLRIEGKIERRGSGPFDLMSAVGAHELVVDTPDHHSRWADFDIDHMALLLESYLSRFNDLRRDPRFRQIVVVKNHGAPWSRYLHGHSHIVATPFVPRRLEDEIAGAEEFYRLKERCVFCDCLHAEVQEGTRVIAANLDFVAYAPFASGLPFEIWILPRQHSADFGSVSPLQLPALAAVFRDTMLKLRATLQDPHFSLALHSGPLDGSQNDVFHWHWELIPHLSGELGMEWATGVYFNPVAPEDAATTLREGQALPQSGSTRS
jgi:UDPglucose--hexose-1-phosphate uridylyltransferase